MFPCSSIYQHFPRTNQTMIRIDDITIQNGDKNNFPNQNPISSNGDHYSLPYSNNAIPSIFEDDGVILSHLLSQQQLLACNVSCNNSYQYSHTNNDKITGKNHLLGVEDHKPSKGSNSKRQTRTKTIPAPRKRVAGKKDRHSKIYTAQGLRDRRMRLSLQIARKFFDLQDMLGFDKASRTIDWLFAKSKTAIKELKDSLLPKHQLSSSNSTSAMVSTEKDEEKPASSSGGNRFSPSSSKETKKTGKKTHKVVARESRDKARARARERTRGKILEKSRQSSANSEAETVNSVNFGEPTIIRPGVVFSTSLIDPKGAEESKYNSDLRVVRDDQAEQDNLLQLDYSSLSQCHVGVSSWTNSEDDFLGFPQNWDIMNSSIMSKTMSFCHTNPCAFFKADSGDLYSTYEQKPSSNIKFPATSNNQNPSFVYVPRTASSAQSHSLNTEEQNPNPIFVASLNVAEHQEENPTSDFLSNSNIFCSLSF